MPKNLLPLLSPAEIAKLPMVDIISALEGAVPGRGYAPGTILQRILLDKEVAKSYGLAIPHDDRESVPAWCLALGHLNERKFMFYGWTITEVVTAAVKELLK